MSLDGKVALITGGTSGMGLACAITMAKEGATIVVCGRHSKKWTSARKKIPPELKDHIGYRKCDVRIEGDITKVIDQMHSQYGYIDIFVNCAGVQPVNDGDITKMEFESVEEKDYIVFRIPKKKTKGCGSYQSTPVSDYCESPLATSVFGIFFSLKQEIKYALEKQPEDRPVSIVSISSRNGILPDAHRPDYAAAKAFIGNLTQSLAAQVAQKVYQTKRKGSIRVNCIAPGPVDTPLETALFKHYEQEATKGVPMGRTAKPEEIAPLILFLCQPDLSGYITGSVIPIDGGHTGAPVTGSLVK